MLVQFAFATPGAPRCDLCGSGVCFTAKNAKSAPRNAKEYRSLGLCLISRVRGRLIGQNYFRAALFGQTLRTKGDILGLTYMKEVYTWVHVVERRLQNYLDLRNTNQSSSDMQLLLNTYKPSFTISTDCPIRTIA